MMSGGGALNLSLLSRGVGEVQKNGHEKVEVFLEPSDYFNFATDRPYYLPPIQTDYHFAEASPRISTRSARDGSEIPLPKTFTTRKGALLLFSEDMALKANDLEHQHKKSRRHHPMHSSFPSHSSLSQDETAIVLKTVDDLAKSILQYGSSRNLHDDHGKMYLKFIHRRHEQWERQIRPGYSAKRYLSTWTRNWDDQVFETVVSKGYLTERSLFHYNLFLPNLRRQLFHEDLSIMPQPYRLMKNMLLTPGSLSGYTFYRVPQSREFGTVIEEDEDDADGMRVQRPDTKKSIRVIRTTREGVQKEVSYSALDKDTQREVITDLLVKSAVHYALSKQEEIMEESIAQAIQSEQDGMATSYPELSETRRTPAQRSVPGFDMRTAVDSLLDTHRGGPYVLGGDLPDADTRSYSSEHTGSFKGGAVPQHAARAMGARQTPRGSWPVSLEDAGKEFMGNLPVAAFRDMSTASSSQSSIPQLPPIAKAPLSPIKDVSRETTQLLTLPRIHGDDYGEGKDHPGSMPTVQVMPPTPQHSTLTTLPTSRSDAQHLNKELQRVAEADLTVAEVSGYNVSSGSTPTDLAAPAPTQRTGRKSKVKGPKVTHGTAVRRRMKDVSTSTQNGRSLAAGSLESKSLKGSMIMAPDGEIISVGGSVVPPRPHDVGVISDVTQQQRHYEANVTDESGMSDDEPEEWRATGRVKKPRSISSKKSDSVKRSIKRDSETSSGSVAKGAVWSQKGGKESGAGESIIIKRYSVASKASQGARSSVTEQDILDTLAEHAKRIADSVLSNKDAGQDLEKDVKEAADMWMETHSTRDISRSHSVQDVLKSGAIEEIMNAQRSSSAGPTTAEYKDLIRHSLTTAVAKAAGLDPEEFPEDAEISPDLLEALANQKLTPDDIAIYHDVETGRPVIKSRQEIAQALGGVAEGHIYLAPNGKGGSYAGSETGIKRQMSIPADRASLVDNMEYDVISYGGTEVMSERGRPAGRSKAGSKPGSIAGGTIADLRDHPIEQAKGPVDMSPEAEQDEFEQRLQQMEKEGAVSDKKSPSQKSSIREEERASALPSDGSPKLQLELDGQSEKSVKTGVSQKTEKSEDSKKKEKKTKTPDEPFVVGMPKHKAELSQLYGTQGPGTLPQAATAPKPETKSPVKGKKPKKDDKKEKGKKKGKKGKKEKKEEEAIPEAEPAPAAEAPPPEPVIETKEPVVAPPTSRERPTPKPMTASSSERPLQSSPELKTDDDDMEFNIVREESSPEPDPPPRTALPPTYPVEEEEEEEEEEEAADIGEEDNLKAISNREARAAKRAAAAAKRKEEVERRRKEREEQLKREKEEQERQEQLKREMEMERKRREEERRLRKQQEAEEADREERERLEQERKKRLAEEKERKAKEEYQRKLEEMKRKQIEEEARRMELLLQKQKEEEERRAQEELMLSQMAEQERLEYERKKQAEEEERKRKEEEERLKREEEARQAMEEAKRLAEEMARKQAELEARLKFNRALQVEAGGLDHSHDINRAFVFSYFELLQWLGLDIPEFELAKMNQL